MATYAIQERAVSVNPDAGPQGKGWQEDIAFTLEARNKVQAVCGLPTVKAANDNAPADAGAQRALRFLSVCSGIEAASTAWHPLGWRAVAFSEIEKFPSAVLAHHYPDVPNLGDFTKIDTTKLGQVDILAGGTPCQAFSVAGLRQGLDDARGNLTLKFVELAHELAAGNGLRNVVWENVVGVLSDKGNAFGCFLAGLVGADDAVVPSEKPADGKSNKHWKWRKGGRYAVLDEDGEETGEYETREPWHAISWPSHGMVAGPKGRAAWAVKDAQFFGVAQRRRRVLVVADFGNGADPAAVLFEPESVCRHPPARGEAGKSITHPIAPSIVSSGRGVERTGDTRGQDPVVAVLRGHSDYGDGLPSVRSAGGDCAGGSEALVFAPEIARCVATREGSSQDYETTTMVAIGVTGQTSHALTAEGADASEDGTGRRTPVVAFVQNSRDEVRLMGGDGSIVGALAAEPGAKQQCYLAQTVAIRGRDGGATAELGGEVATALRASQGGGDKSHVLAFDSYNQATDDVAHTLRSARGSGDEIPDVLTSAVRRLTPMECERLQGFPDNYSRIPWRGKPADQCPDGPRYKALGNSWAVPKFVWLGKRINMLMPQDAAAANDNTATSSEAA
jgi:DNA (cytosine-5)-methyltransferase 1